MRFAKILLGTLAASCLALGCEKAGDVDVAQVIEPLPQEFPIREIQKDAVIVRLSEALFANINLRWKDMLQRLIVGTDALLEVPELSGAEFNAAGDLVIPLHIPCQEVEADGVTIRLCDEGKGKCTQNADGEMTTSCEISLLAKGFSLQPQYKTDTSGVVMAEVEAALDTGTTGLQLGINYNSLSPNCTITYKKGASTKVSGGLKLSLDATSPNPLHFELAEVSDGIYVSGIDNLDIGTGSDNTIKLDCGATYNALLNLAGAIGFTPQKILGLLSKTIQDGVKKAVDKATYQPCTWPNDNENDLIHGTCRTGLVCACVDEDSCKKRGDMRCQDKASGKFVTLYPGYEGRVSVGQFLSSFGADPTAAFDFSALVGGSLELYEGRPVNGVKTGNIDLGAMLGLKNYPDENSYCVPSMEAPVPQKLKKNIDFDQEAPAGHQIGLAVSEYLLNNLFYQATRSGLLCVSVGTELSDMISSALFSGFVPSLGLLGEDLPMQLAIRPTQAPYLTFGKNVLAGGKISDPLMTLNFKSLNVDFYALVEERMARLFTVNVDISAPVALDVKIDEETKKTMVHPVLGSLTKMITFNEIDYNSEILTEDIADLGTQISGLLGLADTIVTGLIDSYPLPDIFGLRFSFDGFTGMGETTEGTQAYLGAFFSVAPVDGSGGVAWAEDEEQ